MKRKENDRSEGIRMDTTYALISKNILIHYYNKIIYNFSNE